MNEETPLCMCMAVVARQFAPVRFEWHGPTLWAFWAECPEHHETFTSPGWHRHLGQLDKVIASAGTEAIEVRR